MTTKSALAFELLTGQRVTLLSKFGCEIANDLDKLQQALTVEITSQSAPQTLVQLSN